jgi:hypothetical protein
MTRNEKAFAFSVDRREFIGAAFAAAFVPIGSLVPTGPVAAAVTGPALYADQHIDDQWSGFPRYAHPIGPGRRVSAPRPTVHPADEQFVAI